MASPSEIIRCLKYDGYTLEHGAQYCRRIAASALYSGPDCQKDADAYTQAAEALEAQAKAEKLALENAERLEEENRHLAARVFELEKTIVKLTTI